VQIPLLAGVIDTTICEKLVSAAKGQWFSPGTPVSSINKTDRHDIDEILLNKGNNKITELRTILQRESQNS
jgi:hypothetical protein